MEVEVLIKILWITYAVLASVIGFFLSAIDVLSNEEGLYLAIFAILAPYLEVFILALMLLWYLHDLIENIRIKLEQS